MRIFISERVRLKLERKHGGITLKDIVQCFANRSKAYMIDDREDHLTNPLTRWFIAENDRGQLLKICFIPLPDKLLIKTAYPPNEDEISLFGESKDDEENS